MTYRDEHEGDQTRTSSVIDELCHWLICPNCAGGLSEVDIEELEACSQCGVRLNPTDYEKEEPAK